MWDRSKFCRAAGMETPNRRALLLLSMLLLSQADGDPHSVAECCRQPSRSCPLYVLFCRSGSKSLGGSRSGDAAAGILTLGKRNEEEHRLQSRLQQLLHGPKNQAAGILTMGKRTEEMAGQEYMNWLVLSKTTIVTPFPF